MTATHRPRPSERALVEQGARYLEGLGYRTWSNLDGTDYFDLVGRRGDEVGLVEAKVADRRTVLAQALTRRVWGDWVAVLVGSKRSAERLAAQTHATRAAPVGVWTVEAGRVVVLRPARPWVVPGEADPYAELRGRFRRTLDALERGDLPAGLVWDSVPGSVRRASGGRKFKEWRLDEANPTEP
ncbi:MAG TPA: hypothetical protein VMI55_06510 [Thermoplasmata archaeon]|nr:hypothetical protein [Thermoplasmata archaeon]